MAFSTEQKQFRGISIIAGISYANASNLKEKSSNVYSRLRGKNDRVSGAKKTHEFLFNRCIITLLKQHWSTEEYWCKFLHIEVDSCTGIRLTGSFYIHFLRWLI